MRLRNHVAYRFLTDPNLAVEMIRTTYPEFDGSDNHPLESKCMSLASLLSIKNQTSYYITETVIDKLDILKVKRNSDGNFHWAVFNHIPLGRITFILPDDKLIRVLFTDNVISFAFISVGKMYDARNGELKWVLFYIGKEDGKLSANFNDKDVKDIDELVYKILCFMYLSDNEEVIVEAGHRYGTRKSGKLVNELPFKVTVVNSMWNITSIRTEGFSVRGHLAIRWSGEGRSIPKMVFIQPFEKHGYKRIAKSTNN